MKTYIWLGLLVVVGQGGAPPVRSDGPMHLTSDHSLTLFEEGRDALLHFRLADAERAFRTLARRPDGGIAAYYHLSTTALVRLFIYDEGASYDAFFDRSDSLKKLLDTAPESQWTAYLAGEAALQRALVRAKQRSYLRAAWGGRSAYRALAKAIELHPTFYESYKGMGLLYLAIGALPRRYRQFLKMMGYEGTIRQGLDALTLAATRSTYSREEARIYLGLADVLLNGSKGGGKATFHELAEAYPDSPLFGYLYGFSLLSNRDAQAAAYRFQKAIQDTEKAGADYLDYLDYYLADALFRLHRFEEAANGYGRYLRRHRGQALRAMALLQRGQALEMLGRRAEAVDNYKQVKAEREYDSDLYAERMAKRLRDAPMNETDRALLLARTAYAAGDYPAALTQLTALTASPVPGAVQRSEAYYWLGRTYEAEGRYDEAERAYSSVQTDDEKHRWAPWSRLYLGDVTLARGDTAGAVMHYREALAWKGDFDFYQTLEQNARAALDRLDQPAE